MSTIVYAREYSTNLNNLKECIAAEMEEGARKLREDGEFQLYLGESVFAHISFKDEAGVTIEA